MENNKMSVLPVDYLRGHLDTDEFDTLSMYQLLGNGVVKENAGIKMSHCDYIVYDVTNAKEETKRAYADYIFDIDVHKVIKGNTFKRVSRESYLKGKSITTLMSILGVYRSLTTTDKEELGYDFVNVEDTPLGIKITPIFRGREFTSGNVYLRLSGKPIPQELFEIISNDITELTKKDDYFYEITGYSEQVIKKL